MDIRKLLEEWPYGERGNVRIIRGEDGREKAQIRVCIDSYHGILQFECDGRPDGIRPRGREFFLDYLEERKRRKAQTSAEDFAISPAECQRLFEESMMTCQRYIVMLQLQDYDRVIRDTERNMRLFRFVSRHAAEELDRHRLECWWPYLLRINGTARAMQFIDRKDYDNALKVVDECRQKIRALPPQENETFQQEMQRSGAELDRIEAEIRRRRPLPELERLERDKARAIQDQRYEDAARLRDRIEELNEKPGKEPGKKPGKEPGKKPGKEPGKGRNKTEKKAENKAEGKAEGKEQKKEPKKKPKGEKGT